MAVAEESEFLAVNQKIRVRIPAVTPFHKARDAKIVEAAACKPALTRCESGRALHFGALVQEQDDAMALRRSGCDCGSCRYAVTAPRLLEARRRVAFPVTPPFRRTQRVRAFSPTRRPP